jgi:hypothetical protein
MLVNMTKVNGLIWDDWNKNHLAKHKVTVEEVEEACRGKYQAVETYRRRIQLVGRTKNGRN